MVIHNPKVGGSIRPPATDQINNLRDYSVSSLGVLTPRTSVNILCRQHLAKIKTTVTLQQICVVQTSKLNCLAERSDVAKATERPTIDLGDITYANDSVNHYGLHLL